MIIIIDFGSQYSQLIARALRRLHFAVQVVANNLQRQDFLNLNPSAIILSGGPDSVYQSDASQIPAYLFEFDCPILGICYGMQLIAKHFGGVVKSNQNNREYGKKTISINDKSPLFNNISNSKDFSQDAFVENKIESEDSKLNVWMSHSDSVVSLPNNFHVIAKCLDGNTIAAIANDKAKIYGLQFHPEVMHTDCGEQILENFTRNICKLQPNFTPSAVLDNLINEVKTKVKKDEKVVLAVSGGCDSTVLAFLLHEILGERFIPVFVDHGFLRVSDLENVKNIFREKIKSKLYVVNASETFLEVLNNVSNPEQKRKKIGNLFIKVFEAFTKSFSKSEKLDWLAQGTIYSDVIESGKATLGGKASNVKSKIKSHHNVGGLPKNMNMKLLEPFRKLFKDDVRRLGLELGVPKEILYQHPFPGPGLAIRMIGKIKPYYLELLRKADAIFIEALKSADLYYKLSQAFALFLPVKSVGVMGDVRKHEYTIALRAVETEDYMTARAAHLPQEFLSEVSRSIVNKVSGISRVVYDLSDKPPGTIEWE